MDSQDVASPPPPPAEVATFAPAVANGVESQPSDGETFLSGDEEFQSLQGDKVVTVAPASGELLSAVGSEAAGAAGNTGSVVEKGFSEDAVKDGASRGGFSETLVSEAGGLVDSAVGVKVEPEGDAGAKGGELVAPVVENPVIEELIPANPVPSSPVDDSVGEKKSENAEVYVPNVTGSGEMVEAVEEKGFVNSGARAGEVLSDVKSPKLGEESSEVLKAGVSQEKPVDVVSEAPVPSSIGVEVGSQSVVGAGGEEVEPLMEPEQVLMDSVAVATATAGDRNLAEVEPLIASMNDTKANGNDRGMQETSIPVGHEVGNACATMEKEGPREDVLDAVTGHEQKADGSVMLAESHVQESTGISVGGGSRTVDLASDSDQQQIADDDTLSGDGDHGEVLNPEYMERVEALRSSEAVKQLLQDLIQGGSVASAGVGGSNDFVQEIDGQIATDESEEEADTDEEGGGKELFNSEALAALLRAATGASSDGNVPVSAADATRIFSVDRPAGLGTSMPSLRPGPSRTARLTPSTSSDLTVTGETENNMNEEERALHEKVEQIRVKFLRLVHRLGHSAEDTVAAQVLYRLGLAEGIKRGRQTNRAFSIENAKRKALSLEDSGEEPLEFSCNILVLGKTGVGKSSIINSILSETCTATSAFKPSTTGVRELVGVVDGVKVRFLDTPGLKSSVMEQNFNKKVLSTIKRFTKKCPPDIVLYVDRLDIQTRDFNDLPLLRSIASVLGSSIWFNAIVALTHAASAPPDGPSGTPLGYEVFVAQRSHVVQHSIRQAAGDMRLMNPVALVENHPSCRRNREGQRVLPNGTAWKPQLLLLCYSSKTLSEANSLLKLQDPAPGKLFGFRMRSPPLPYLLSSLLQSRPYPKLPSDQGLDIGDSDDDMVDLLDSDDEEEEDEFDKLPPFKTLWKFELDKLTKEQKKQYFDEYDYRLKLLQKKQWKAELRRLKELKKQKKKGGGKRRRSDYNDYDDGYDQDGAPAAVPVPLPDMVLPPSFDCNNPVYRYRFLEPTSQLLARPVLDNHGWDHDCGYDGVSLEETLALWEKYPASYAVQVTKDKKEFNVRLDSSVAAKLGEKGSSLAGFDIQSVGRQLAYILRGETKFRSFKKNRTAAGVSVTFLGENIVTGLKVEDQVVIANRLCFVGSTGAVRSRGDTAYGANLEARIRAKDYPIGQELGTLELSLMKWRRDLALGGNLQTQVSVGRNTKMAIRVGLNNKLTGQFTVRTSTSDQLQIALVAIIPIAVSIMKSVWPSESF